MSSRKWRPPRDLHHPGRRAVVGGRAGPEITVAIQSLLKAGFLSAVQPGLLFMIGVFIPLQRQSDLRVSEILFLNMV
jgi:hypothetical protein